MPRNKSTTGLALKNGVHVLRTNSNTQSDIGLSSGESEFYGAVKAASVGLGAQAMFEDLGVTRNVVIRMDSTAGEAISERLGLGKTRHISTRYFWIQQGIRKKELTIEKEPGITNCSDLMTKVQAEAGILKHLTATSRRAGARRHRC